MTYDPNAAHPQADYPQPNLPDPAHPEPPKRKRKGKRALQIVGALALVGLGAAIGSSGADSDETTAAPPEPAEVETIVETETITETVEVEVVPGVCADALDDADTLMQLSGESHNLMAQGFELAAQGIDAASVWDWETLDAITAEVDTLSYQLDDVNARIEASTYALNRDACLATP